MHALVLAAGDGDRLQSLSNGTPKSLLTLGGRPIIAHVLESLAAGGVREATIVVGYEGEAMRRAVAVAQPRSMTVRFVENPGFMLGNARSIWAARELMAGSPGFVLAMADHVVDVALVRTVVDGADGRCRLAVERAEAGDERANEATRALVDAGKVSALGKAISPWNALDTGVFWCSPRVFEALTPSLRDGEASAVFAALAGAGELDAVDVTGHAWIDIDTPDDLRAAERMLARRAS